MSLLLLSTDAAVAYELAAESGTFTITGTDASLVKAGAYVLAADAGSFTITGTAATFLTTRTLVAASGSFVITGTAATLSYSGGLPADPLGGVVVMRASSRTVVMR